MRGERPLSATLCLILQLTIIGWLPAAIGAVYPLERDGETARAPAERGWGR